MCNCFFYEIKVKVAAAHVLCFHKLNPKNGTFWPSVIFKMQARDTFIILAKRRERMVFIYVNIYIHNLGKVA